MFQTLEHTELFNNFDDQIKIKLKWKDRICKGAKPNSEYQEYLSKFYQELTDKLKNIFTSMDIIDKDNWTSKVIENM